MVGIGVEVFVDGLTPARIGFTRRRKKLSFFSRRMKIKFYQFVRHWYDEQDYVVEQLL